MGGVVEVVKTATLANEYKLCAISVVVGLCKNRLFPFLAYVKNLTQNSRLELSVECILCLDVVFKNQLPFGHLYVASSWLQ